MTNNRRHRYPPHQQQNLRHRDGAPVEHHHRVTIIHNQEYRKIEKELREEQNALFTRKRHCSGAKRHLIDQEIKKKATWFNVEVSKGQGPTDLHGMTVEIALAAVRDELEKGKNIGKFEFITGKGNHSPDHEARIKKAVFGECEGRHRCRIKEDEENTDFRGLMLGEKNNHCFAEFRNTGSSGDY